MPFYEYSPDGESCDFCRGSFEVLQNINEPLITHCPQCHRPCHKIMSTFSIGSGQKAKTPPSNSDVKSQSKKHNHNCAAVGCSGKAKQLLEKYRK